MKQDEGQIEDRNLHPLKTMMGKKKGVQNACVSNNVFITDKVTKPTTWAQHGNTGHKHKP